jgi:hypothetical protein
MKENETTKMKTVLSAYSNRIVIPKLEIEIDVCRVKSCFYSTSKNYLFLRTHQSTKKEQIITHYSNSSR